MSQATTPASQPDWIEFTPAMAAEALTRTNIQRRLKRHVAAAYATDMREGRWGQDVNCIVFDVNGDLINGQHRLTAVIWSKCTIGFWVIRGLPVDDILRMDQGSPRTASDQLHILGATNTNCAAAAAGIVLRYELVPDRVWANSSCIDVTKSLIVDEVATSTEDYELAYSASRGMENAGVVRSVAMALHVLVNRRSPNAELWQPFAQGIGRGANLGPQDPRLAVRNYWVRRDRTRAWGGQQSNLLAMLQAWNKFVAGQPLKMLKHPRREQLPMPTPK